MLCPANDLMLIFYNNYSNEREIMRHLSRRAFVAGLGASLAPVQFASAFAPQKIVVVGAGLAGLAAAYELREAGQDATLIEQSDRVGGRVKTIRGQFADDAWVDVGGQTTGAFYANFFYYSAKFELPFEAQQESAARAQLLLHMQDRLYSAQALQKDPELWPLALHAHEKPLAPSRLLFHYLGPIAQEIATVENVLSPDFADYDKLSLRQLLVDRGASDAAIALIDKTLNYNSVDTVSALSVLRDTVRMLHMRGGQALNLENGNASLPEAFAARLADNIRYRHSLSAVSQSSDGVRLQVETNGASQTLYADRVVLAIPFTALRKIRIEPGLPAARQAIIDTLPYTQIAQTYLQTTTRFWEPDAAVAMVVSDGPLERLFNLSKKMKNERGLLLNWVNGSGVSKINAHDPERHLQFVRQEVRRIWPAAKGQIEETLTNDWGQSYVQGAYAHYAPGQMAKYASEIPKPIGRLHFAGEHTELIAPGMEGALTSGKRVATEVLGGNN